MWDLIKMTSALQVFYCIILELSLHKVSSFWGSVPSSSSSLKELTVKVHQCVCDEIRFWIGGQSRSVLRLGPCGLSHGPRGWPCRIVVVESRQQTVTAGLGLNCLVGAPCLDGLLLPLSLTGNKGFETAISGGGGQSSIRMACPLPLSWRWELLALIGRGAASPGMLL